MGDWATERRDRSLATTLGKLRFRGRASLKLRRQEIEPLVVYTSASLVGFVDTLMKQQGTSKPAVPKWRNLSPWMKVQIAHLAMCEYDSQAFTVHIHPDLMVKLDLEENKSDYLRRRFRHELAGVFHYKPAYYIMLELHDAQGKRVSPHIHGGVEIFGVDRARVELALRRACGQSMLRRGSTHNALKIEDTYGHVDRWGKYVCKGLRRKAPKGWKRRHAVSNELTGAARSFWEHIVEAAESRIG